MRMKKLYVAAAAALLAGVALVAQTRVDVFPGNVRVVGAITSAGGDVAVLNQGETVTGAWTFNNATGQVFQSTSATPLIVKSRASDEIGAILLQNSGGGQAGFLQNANGVIQLGAGTTVTEDHATTSVTVKVPAFKPVNFASTLGTNVAYWTDVFYGRAVSNSITPTALSGTVNDWNPASLQIASFIRASTTSGGAAEVLNGMAAPTNGGIAQTVIIQNLGPDQLTFTAENAGSAAANRFSKACILNVLWAATYTYESGSQRWHLSGCS